MTIEVQMLARRPKGPGEWYEKGSTYELNDDLASVFVRNGVARRTSLVSELTEHPAQLQPLSNRYDIQDGLVDPVTLSEVSGATSFGVIVRDATFAFQKGLERYGAVLSGVSNDDAPVQEALDFFAAEY